MGYMSSKDVNVSFPKVSSKYSSMTVLMMPSGWSGRLCRLYPIFSKMWSVTLLFASPVITSAKDKTMGGFAGANAARARSVGVSAFLRFAFTVFADCALAKGEEDKRLGAMRRTLALDDDGLGDGGAR